MPNHKVVTLRRPQGKILGPVGYTSEVHSFSVIFERRIEPLNHDHELHQEIFCVFDSDFVTGTPLFRPKFSAGPATR